MPKEKTLDGRFIDFPEGYDTPEGRKRIVVENMPYDQDDQEKELIVSFILTRGIIKEFGGDDKFWKDQNGEWKFNPPKAFVDEVWEIFYNEAGRDINTSTIIARSRVAHPLYSVLWLPDEGESKQTKVYTNDITVVYNGLLIGTNKLANPNNRIWTDELRQKRDEYFIESVGLLHLLISETGNRTSEDFERRRDNFKEAFSQSSFAGYVELPDDLKPYNNVKSVVIMIRDCLKSLDKEKVRQAREKKLASDIVQRILDDEDIIPLVDEFESQLSETQDQQAFIKDRLRELQTQIGSVPPEKRSMLVERFARDKRLSEYIKELYNRKCQFQDCELSFERKDGKLYVETHHMQALSEGGDDNIENIIVVCAHHHKMLEYANVSILDAKPENISVEINGEKHIIRRDNFNTISSFGEGR